MTSASDAGETVTGVTARKITGASEISRAGMNLNLIIIIGSGIIIAAFR